MPHLSYGAAFYHEADTLDWDTLVQGMQEWNELKKYFYSDFYVLTPQRSTTEREKWTAWEYFDKDTDSGVIQAFRLPDCAEDTYKVYVKGVDPDKYYTVSDVDGGNVVKKIKGSALANIGLPLFAKNPRTALIVYIQPYQD